MVPLSGTAVRGEFNFFVEDGGFEGVPVGVVPAPDTPVLPVPQALNDEPSEPSGRYIIDNFTFTPAGEKIIADVEGALPDNPILPGEIIQDPDNNDVPQFVFEGIVIDQNGLGVIFPIFIDPDVAVGYDYEVVSGPNFASVEVPATSLLDDTFTLTVPGFGPFLLQTGVAFDLTALDPLGFSSFRISDIDANEMLDPNDPLAFITGMTYVAGGIADVTMTPITEFVPPSSVPEPPVVVLTVLSLIGAGWRMRKSAA
ncbi:MAG: hypothetical protein GY703_19385 [Gammaproteobacteria bacterium]|nr:hypothetical protein [Gammaproteobacteria bacterium]